MCYQEEHGQDCHLEVSGRGDETLAMAPEGVAQAA